MTTHDIAIIGGGISGLSLAHYGACADRSVLLLEKEAQPGGALCSHVPENGDFFFELGAHTCYNSYGRFIELLADYGLMESIQPRVKAPFKMLVDDRLASIVSQINLFELLFSAPKMFFLKKAGQTVRSYYGRIVGEKNFARTFSAVFSAVPSQKADEFPADLLFKKRARNKDIAKSFTLQGGLQSVARAIAADPAIDYVGGQQVQSLQRTGDIFTVKTADGSTYGAHQLALATSPSVAAQLLADLAPELAQHLSMLAVASVDSIGVAVDRDRIALASFGGAIPRDDALFSVVSRDVVPHKQYRGFTFHFAAGALSRDERLARICAVLDVAPDELVCIGEKVNCVPSPRLGHAEWVATADRLANRAGVLLTGNYFAGLSIEDCIQRSFQQSERLSQNA